MMIFFRVMMGRLKWRENRKKKHFISVRIGVQGKFCVWQSQFLAIELV
jgi:hypothetical protein